MSAAQAHAAGLPERELDVYGLDPQVSDPLVLGWMTAVARHTGGEVVSADRRQVLVPDAGAAVDLTLWTGTVVPSGDLVAAVRPFLAGSRLGPVEQTAGGGYTVTSRFEFDGALTLTAEPRDAVPVCCRSNSSATCCVIVEPPSTTRRARRFFQAARTIATGSTPT